MRKGSLMVIGTPPEAKHLFRQTYCHWAGVRTDSNRDVYNTSLSDTFRKDKVR